MQIAELFQKDKVTISEHISHIFQDIELTKEATVRNFRTVQKEGNREVSRDIALYNLDVVISVGYRVKSIRGTQFRMWATQRLKEYLIKGFALDDQRLKQAGGGSYFDELLARIRDIRSAEKVFWRKVLDIYATSIRFHLLSLDDIPPIEQHFIEAIEMAKKIAKETQDGLFYK